MKNIWIYIFVSVLLISACSSNKDSVKKNENSRSIEEIHRGNNNDKGFQQMSAKEREKLRKENKKQNAKLEKESKAKKEKEAKEEQKKQKELDKLLKDAAKNEKKRIEEEREQEKQALIKSIKHIETDKENVSEEENENIASQLGSGVVDTTITIKDIIGDSVSDAGIVKDVKDEENNSFSGIKNLRNKAENLIVSDEKQKVNIDSLTPVDRILYLTEKDANKGKSDEGDEESGNFIKKQWNEMFPKHIDRELTYDNLYAENPEKVMILYPWNRSGYDKADEMLLISMTQELSTKGYYIPSAISMINLYRQDSTYNSRYARERNLRRFYDKYGMDALIFSTIYRFDNASWKTSTDISVHYVMVSTKTGDTLFMRNIEFSYDTPIAPKERRDKSLEIDEQQRYNLGVMEQMTRYSFSDFPKGFRHNEFAKDKKKNSRKRYIKYKINVRPS